MCLNYFFNSFHNALIGTQVRFLSTSTWVGLILCFEFAFSQIENNNPSFSFPPNDGDNSNSLYQLPAEDSPFLRGDFLKKPLDMTDPKLDDKGSKINMQEQERFLNAGDIYLSKLKGKGIEAGKDPNKFRTNQYMGDYRIGGDKARIIFRDHEYPDGDRVRILHNDKVIQPNVLLLERFVGLTIELVPGFNKIDFVALNQGSSGPNTAEVRVYDENGDMTAANQWNLATGVRATYILIKE